MEATLRHLRDGAVKEDGSPCPVVLLCDTLESVGARDILQHIADEYLASCVKGNCQAQRIQLLQLSGSVTLPSSSTVSVLDAWSDPAGWFSVQNTQVPVSSSSTIIDVSGPTALADLLRRLTSGPIHGPPHSTAIMIDDVSRLMTFHSASKVLMFLEQLRSSPAVSCILTCAHQELVGHNIMTGLQRQASCVASIQTLTDLQQSILNQLTGRHAHGSMACSFKSRRTGRVRSETSYYSLLPGRGLAVLQPPSDLAHLMTPEALVALSMKRGPGNATARTASGPTTPGAAALANGTKGAAGQEALPTAARPAAGPSPDAGAANRPGGGVPEQTGSMRLTLTEEEKKAKAAVVLPHLHQSAASAANSSDWKDYLPVAAGGRSAAFNHGHSVDTPNASNQESTKQALGHIHYLRDSDDELHDSDEDPDDDLDI